MNTLLHVITKIVFRIKEYNKSDYSDNSYIICPNHVSDYDGMIMYGLLVSKYNVRGMMLAEYWEENKYPFIEKIADVKPINRTNPKVSELKGCIDYLKATKNLLLFFPQGEYVNLKYADVKRIKDGAFFIAAHSKSPIVPVYIEPPKILGETKIVYGTPINVEQIIESNFNGKVNKESLLQLRQMWLDEILKLESIAKEASERPIRDMTFGKLYRANDGHVYTNHSNQRK